MIYDDFYRNQLENVQSVRFYDDIVRQIESGNVGGVYKLNMVNKHTAFKDSFDAINAVIYDRPDFFFLGRTDRTVIIGSDLTLYNEILYNSRQTQRIRRLLNRDLDYIYRNTIGDDIFTKEKKVYDYIAKIITYENNGEELDHNVVGPILRGKGVCESYAKYLTLAFRKVGIPCIRISGVGHKEHHCWNIAWINAVPYHLDVTWEDVNKNKTRVGSRYFNLTDSEISKDHLILTKGLPRCNHSFIRR